MAVSLWLVAPVRSQASTKTSRSFLAIASIIVSLLHGPFRYHPRHLKASPCPLFGSDTKQVHWWVKYCILFPGVTFSR
jgi:hypothetical protein